MMARPELTSRLARYAIGTRYEHLPDAVRHEATRAFLNWVGVAVGGSGEAAVTLAASLVRDAEAGPRATLVGQGAKADVAGAAFVNCIASSVLAFDDAHLPTVAHPSGPAAAALFALAETRTIAGEEFLNALALGIELQCRVANMLVLPPSTFHPSFYVNGFSGPIGVAAAVGRLIGLDEQRMAWALGLAATQAAGFRSTHGTMTAHLRPGLATRAGVTAALLAELGFDCTTDALEAAGGFLDVYAPDADPQHALAGLGERHEMLANRYKPYPCGIVIHPVIDACLELRAQLPPGAAVAEARLTVNPAVLRLTGKRAPRTTLESHVSVYHWAAAALLYGTAGLAETLPDRLADPAIAALRATIVAEPDADVGKGEARAEVRLTDGAMLRAHVVDARGSLRRPLTDAELDAKFRDLVGPRLSPAQCERLLAACRDVGTAPDVGAAIAPLLP